MYWIQFAQHFLTLVDLFFLGFFESVFLASLLESAVLPDGVTAAVAFESLAFDEYGCCFTS